KNYSLIPSRRWSRAKVEERIKALEAKPEAERTAEESRELADFKKMVEAQERIDALEHQKESGKITSAESAELEKLLKYKFFEGDKHEGNVKPPFEEVFFQALEHHHREGFLHLKLMEPRSYDYNRLKTWDDRLRMPQFKFARTRK